MLRRLDPWLAPLTSKEPRSWLGCVLWHLKLFCRQGSSLKPLTLVLLTLQHCQWALSQHLIQGTAALARWQQAGTQHVPTMPTRCALWIRGSSSVPALAPSSLH